MFSLRLLMNQVLVNLMRFMIYASERNPAVRCCKDWNGGDETNDAKKPRQRRQATATTDRATPSAKPPVS